MKRLPDWAVGLLAAEGDALGIAIALPVTQQDRFYLESRSHFHPGPFLSGEGVRRIRPHQSSSCTGVDRSVDIEAERARYAVDRQGAIVRASSIPRRTPWLPP
jgi:hypothetical protein